MSFVTFSFGETTRSVSANAAKEIVDRLNEQSSKTKTTEPHQLALQIGLRLEGQDSSEILLTTDDRIAVLWPVVDELRTEWTNRVENPEHQQVDRLWQALYSAALQDDTSL